MNWSDLSPLLLPSVLLPWLLGMVFGIFVGAMPGLTATMAVALIIPISFNLRPEAGLAMIIGVSFTAIFAGDIPATLLRIPGTPASAAATLDGHALAKQGRADHALKLDLLCSALGGLISIILLMTVAPQLARFALRFSHYEYFWLAVCGLAISAIVSLGSTFKGVLAAVLGMLIATIGRDMISGLPRFSFGSENLESGVEFIPAMIGLFGLSEVLRSVGAPTGASTDAVPVHRVAWVHTLKTIWRHRWTTLKSSLLGVFIGALPGAGADIAAWAAYGLAQKTSKSAVPFGAGCEEGVIAPTSANNAAVGGAWIPALVFGIPGDAVTAIVLGALIMYDLTPGPLIFQQKPAEMHALFAIGIITQFLLLPAGWIGIKLFSRLMQFRRAYIHAGVVVFSVVGAYALRNNLFDVWVMVGFGLLGWFLERQRVPLAPLILGIILCPMIEQNLRNGLIKSQGSLLPFFSRPICLVILGLLAAAVAIPLLSRWRRNARLNTA
jgi:putative tricarboxylic transport membrane protein